MEIERKNTERLKEPALKEGAALFGVALMEDILDSLDLLSPKVKTGLIYGVSLGVRLSRRILEDVEDHPTKLYYYHYRQLNYTLDRAALKVVDFIQTSGYQALPIPSSQTVDWKNQRGHLSHKAVGRRAGIGWMGRNNLLVNSTYGAQIRYVTVLTDMPLSASSPIEDACGDCRACSDVCPAGAIGSSWESFNRERCLEKLKEFSKRHNIGHYICGICVRACYGSKKMLPPNHRSLKTSSKIHS